MKIIIGYYDSGYWWEIRMINCDLTRHYTRTESTEFVKDIIYNYEEFDYLRFIEWLYAKGYEEIIICDNGSIYYEKKENI